MTTMAEPRAARSTSAWWIAAAAPASTPQVGCETTSTSGTCSTSRPMMNFCRLPPESEPASGGGAGRLDREGADHLLGVALRGRSR